MITAVVVLALIAGNAGSPAGAWPRQSLSLGDDGTYQFFYETGKEAGSHSREEARGSDGVVLGKYSYQDPSGDLRVVNYRADDFGYVAKGDVSVPGAPPGQFPSEDQPEEDKEPAKDDQEVPKSEPVAGNDEEGKDASTTEALATNNEDYEDDVKSIKLQEPSYDGPPDGFPLGFFDQSFQGLRRLPEPTKKEEEEEVSSTTKETGNEHSSTISPPAEPENAPKIENPAVTHLRALFPFSHFNPHTVFDPLHHVGASHHPVYVYSYNRPESHGYYYAY